MQRLGVLALVLCATAVAGCDDAVTDPSNLPVVLTAQLSPANEVPPVANAESSARGAVQITLNVTRDGTGAITSGTAAFHFQLSAPSTTSIIGAHIHVGGAGLNGGVVVNTGITAGTALSATEGVITFTSGAVSVPAATLQAIVNNPAGYYFNVHSPQNPAGVARGQLRRTA